MIFLIFCTQPINGWSNLLSKFSEQYYLPNYANTSVIQQFKYKIDAKR